MSFAINIETHDKICQELHQQIRKLIVENEQLRQALLELRQVLDVEVELDEVPPKVLTTPFGGG